MEDGHGASCTFFISGSRVANLRVLDDMVRPAQVTHPCSLDGNVRKTAPLSRAPEYLFQWLPRFEAQGLRATIDYEPAESTTSMFGGNSNSRGPIWLPLNYLVVSVLERMRASSVPRRPSKTDWLGHARGA